MAKRYIRWVPSPRLLQHISRAHIRLYRATRGLLGGRMDGMDILLLTTRGRKSGLSRTAPLPYFTCEGRQVVVASNGGGPKSPAWYFNLCATPAVEVQLGRRVLRRLARPLEGDAYARAWRQITSEQPRYANYQLKTDRRIPLVALEAPADAPS